jgi:hypothetical protein
MSKMLSGVAVSGSRIESECGGKRALTDAENCTELRDTHRSTNKNRTFLTLAIPRNFARLSARRTPLPVNSEGLHAQEALGRKKKQFTLFKMSVSSRSQRFRDPIGIPMGLEGSAFAFSSHSPLTTSH